MTVENLSPRTKKKKKKLRNDVHIQWRLHVRARVVTGPPWPEEKKKSLLYIKFKNFIIILPLEKCVTTLNFFKSNIIKLWTKFSNKLTWS